MEHVADRLQALGARDLRAAGTFSVEACELHDVAALVTTRLFPALGFEVISLSQQDPQALLAAEEAIISLMKVDPSAWRFDGTLDIDGERFVLRPVIVPPIASCGHISVIMQGLGMRIGSFVELVALSGDVELSDHVQCSYAPVLDAVEFAEFVGQLNGALDVLVGPEPLDDEVDSTPLYISTIHPLYPQPALSIDEFGDVEMRADYVDLEDTDLGVEGDIRTQLSLDFLVEGTVIGQLGGFMVCPDVPFVVPNELQLDRAWLSTLVSPDGSPWPEIAEAWATGDYGPQAILRIDQIFIAPAFQDVVLLRHMVHSALWLVESWSSRLFGLTVEANEASEKFEPVPMSPGKQAWFEAALKNQLGAVRARPYGYVNPLDTTLRPPVFAVPGPLRVLATPLE